MTEPAPPSPTGRRRTATAIRFDTDTHDRLQKAAEDFGLPMVFLVNRAVRDYLDRLIDPADFRLTRDPNPGA